MAGPPLVTASEEEGADNNDAPRWCAEEPCRRRPFFGPVGGKPMFCQQHSKKSEGMVDVSSRRCEAIGCAKWPLYGNEGQKAKFCSLHKGPAMIDVRSRRCAAPDCKRQPSYGFEGQRACYCAAHKADGMVDVVSRRCERPNCLRRPLYGYEGKKSQFCSAHKEEGQVDVCNRRCQHPGCSKRPCFGLAGQRPCFCGSHRAPQMVDVISHKCSYPGCSHPAGYEANRVRSKFCDKHKPAGLAGVSLLQLASAAGAAAAAAAAAAAQTKASPPKPKDSPKCPEGDLSKDPWNTGGGFSVVLDDGREDSQRGAVDNSSGEEPQRRRASYTAPISSTQEITTSASKEDAPKRRFTMPTPLPSLDAILAPRNHLKRPRSRESNDGQSSSSFAMSVDAPNSKPQSAPLAPSGTTAAEDPESSRREGEGKGLRPPGAADRGHPSSDGRGPPPASAAAAAQCRPSAGAKRLFSGTGRATAAGGAGGAASGSGGEKWQGDRKDVAWNPYHPPSETGFLTSTPSPDWRQHGLASLGRSASVDEARDAASRRSLETDEAAQQRRKSAFANNVTSLTPVVMEVHRRVSALEARAAAPRRPHYSDLLSASHTHRSLTASGSPPLRQSPMCRLEEPSPSHLRDGASMTTSEPLWTAPTTQEWALAPAKRSPGSGPPPVGAGAKRIFHVIPAASAYASGVDARHTGGGGAPPPSPASRFDWQRQRHGPPFADRPPMGQHPVQGPIDSKAGTEAWKQSSSAAAGGAGAEQHRRWSVAGQAAANKGDHDGRLFAPAWGAAPEEEGGTNARLDHQKWPQPQNTTAAAVAAAGVAAAATSGSHRASSMSSGRSPGDGEEPTGRPPRHSSMIASSPPGGPESSQARRFSFLEKPLQDLPMDEHHQSAQQQQQQAAAFGPAWGVVPEDRSTRSSAGRSEASATPGALSSRGARRVGILFGAGKRRDTSTHGLPPRSTTFGAPAPPEGLEGSAACGRRWSPSARPVAAELPPKDQRGTPSPVYAPAWGATSDGLPAAEGPFARREGEGSASGGGGGGGGGGSARRSSMTTSASCGRHQHPAGDDALNDTVVGQRLSGKLDYGQRDAMPIRDGEEHLPQPHPHSKAQQPNSSRRRSLTNDRHERGAFLEYGRESAANRACAPEDGERSPLAGDRHENQRRRGSVASFSVDSAADARSNGFGPGGRHHWRMEGYGKDALVARRPPRDMGVGNGVWGGESGPENGKMRIENDQRRIR